MTLRTMLRIGIPSVLVFIVLLIYFSPEAAAFIYQTIAFLSPIWLPALLAYIAWPLWLTFARSQYVASIRYATLELRPGPETPRSAKPMELIFYSLYHRTEVTKRDFLFGKIRMPWSFEVYLHAGSARFFVHVPRTNLEAVAARIQAEYRDIEIDEVRDYAREIPFSSAMRAFSREFMLAKPDPYPLKTYERYEAQSARRDIFAEMLEELSSVGKSEHILISYIVRPHQRERTSYFEDPKDTLHEDAYKVIGGLLGSKGDLHALPPGKQAIVQAIEAGLKKPSFDCGIRALYLAEQNAFKDDTAQKVERAFSRFDDAELNTFTATDPLERTGWLREEFFKISEHLRSHYLVQLFRKRAFFAPPYAGKAFILNTEELATVFHMPQGGRGGVVTHRASVRLDPPENLPV